VRVATQYASAPFVIYMPILDFLCLCSRLRSMYATDRQPDVRQQHRLISLPITGGA